MKASLLLIAALAILAPIVQAQDVIGTALWKLDADELELEGDVWVSGPQAADYRQTIDEEAGNGDGTVTAAEVEAFHRPNQRTFTQDQPDCFDGFEFLRLDGRAPIRVSEFGTEASGAEGRTFSQSELRHRFYVALHYVAPSSDRLTATMKPGRDGEATIFASLECAAGDVSGSEGIDLQRDRHTFLLHPRGEARILEDSIRPAAGRDFWDGQGIRYDSDDDRGRSFPETFTFTLNDPNVPLPPGAAKEAWAWVGYAAAGAAGLSAFALMFTELGRYHLFKFLFAIPGFTRLEKDQVLEHTKRDRLYNFIRTNHGPSFSDLRRSLEMSNGTLVHHLRILEAQEYVKAERDGFRTRFFLRGPKIVAASYLTRTQQQLLDVIRAHPGLTQKELARMVGLPRQNLFYHARQLASQGKLVIKQDGSRRTYWLGTAALGKNPL